MRKSGWRLVGFPCTPPAHLHLLSWAWKSRRCSELVSPSFATFQLSPLTGVESCAHLKILRKMSPLFKQEDLLSNETSFQPESVFGSSFNLFTCPVSCNTSQICAAELTPPPPIRKMLTSGFLLSCPKRFGTQSVYRICPLSRRNYAPLNVMKLWTASETS